MTHYRHHHKNDHQTKGGEEKSKGGKEEKKVVVYSPTTLRYPWTQWIAAEGGAYWYRYTFNFAGMLSCSLEWHIKLTNRKQAKSFTKSHATVRLSARTMPNGLREQRR